MKRKKTLLRIFLIPLIGIVLVQGVLPFSMLSFNGIKTKLENSVVSMTDHMIENRQMVLQNAMIEQWSAVSEESAGLTERLQKLLTDNMVDVEGFLHSDILQQMYLGSIFPELVMSLQHNTASGLFVILTNNKPVEQAAEYNGFFIRDSDPQTKLASNTDLMLERGGKGLAHTESISLDSSWATNFRFEGRGVRSADNFFYEPYMAAVNNKDADMKDLGYWSEPFVLEEHYMDSHKMITYSIPLMYDGRVYGVIGVEIALNYLDEYFPVRDLDENMNAGYAIVIRQDDGGYYNVTGKGSLYEAVIGNGQEMTLTEQQTSGLYRVDGVEIGSQGIYAIMHDLSIYSNNVPYADTKWALCGYITENSIYGLGRRLYVNIFGMVLVCAAAGILAVVFLIRHVTKPVYRLMDSVRGGTEGIHRFQPSNIIEIDELHEVVLKMTDAQRRTEEQLREEKERYRVAVESSMDVFFTYSYKDKILEVTNSNGYDGKWDIGAHPEYMECKDVHPQDRAKVSDLFRHGASNINVDYRLRKAGTNSYRWVNLTGSIIPENEGGQTKLVGCIRDIDQQKQMEMAQSARNMTDPVTSFYTMEAGKEEIHRARQGRQEGTFLLLDIVRFQHINKQYGLTFGDILLEQLAVAMLEECSENGVADPVLIRAGADEIAGWLPGIREERACHIMYRVRERFAGILNNNAVELDFKCGITYAAGEVWEDELLRQAQAALAYIEDDGDNFVVYQQMDEAAKKQGRERSFGEVISTGRTEKLGLVSLVLNLFDKDGYTPVVLDVLSIKLREKYDMQNLIITEYSRDKAVMGIEYIWHTENGAGSSPDVISYEEEALEDFILKLGTPEGVSVEEMIHVHPALKELLEGRPVVMFHMTDGGHYAGSILYVGIKEPEAGKELREIGALIQHRLNQEKHDLSARAKSEFLARMSHEIRTPMNGIMGMTEIALKPEQTEEKRIDCLNKIKGASGYLLRLINDILDMSKIESGKMQLVMGSFPLKEQMQALQYLLDSRLEEKKLRYEEDIRLEHTMFYGDEVRVNQIVINLLGNAIKYSNEGGTIKLSVVETPVDENYSDISFAVEDNGIGISEEDQQRVFQSFEQVNSVENAKQQGTGLGLAISNRLVRMMGSSIKLNSRLGAGSRFSFVLRLRRAQEAEIAPEADVGNVSLAGRRVLAAEDNELNQEIIETILEDNGMIVDIAQNGKEAVEKFRASAEGYYDMILMDIMMPEMDGLEATAVIRRLQRADSRTVPIVAMSANAFYEDVKRSLESGMNDHLSKPISIKKLKAVLDRYLQ